MAILKISINSLWTHTLKPIYIQHSDLFKDVMKYTFVNRRRFVPYRQQTPLPLHWPIVTAVQGNDRYSLRKSYETNTVLGANCWHSYIEQQVATNEI